MFERQADMANYLKKLIQDKKADLKVEDVFYGDRNKIPRTPAVCIDSGEKTNELNGAPRRVMTTLTVYVIVYHNRITTTDVVREEDDNRAEDIEALIHLDAYMKDADGNDQVIDSLVSSVESGYQQRSGQIYRASRLTVEARVQRQLPYPQ